MKRIVLSRSWGLSVKEANRIAGYLGLAGTVAFAPAIVRGSGGPRIAAARLRDVRGARFCAAERRMR